MSNNEYGPNGDAVAQFIQSLADIAWFEQAGQPLDPEDNARQVDFHFIAERDSQPYSGWGTCLAEADQAIDRLLFDHSLIGVQDAVQQAIRIENLWDEDAASDFYEMLDETYGDPDIGYYGNSYTYPHELVSLPDRIVRCAALEIAVAPFAELSFFQGIMPWFQRGHWPCGWEGDYPEGRLIVW